MLEKLIICLIAGIGAGFGTGLAGLSAAAVISPMLITFLGVKPYEAIGIALASDVLASAVPIEYVKEIEKYGGKLTDSVGIPEEQLRKAAKSAVCKINIDSDGRLAMTGTIRKVLAEKPSEFDPRKYLGPAREALKKMYMHKNIDVLGSAGHALD